MSVYVLVFLSLLLGLRSAAEAVTRYVGTAGSDGNSCATSTSSTPTNAKRNFLGASGAIACMSAGDTLRVHAGTYTEAGTTPVGNTIPSGSSGAPTIIMADVITNHVSGVWLKFCSDPPNAIIRLDNKSWITFDGINTDGCLRVVGNGYDFATTVNNIVVKNAEVKEARQQGLITRGNIQTIQFVRSHDNGKTNGFDHGIYSNGTNTLVEDSEFYNNTLGFGIHNYKTTGGVDNNTYRRNKMYNNKHGAFLGQGSNILFYANLVYNNANKALSVGATSNLKIYNNTLYNNNNCGIEWSQADIIEAKNNIIYQHSAVFCNKPSGTIETNNLTTNPPFANPGAGDFHLTAASTGAINQGADLTATVALDFGGTTYSVPMEIGAYNFGTQVTPLVLKFSAPPVESVEDVVMPNAVVVRVEDAAGALQTGHANNCVMALASGTGNLTGTLTVAPSGGICTYTDLTFDTTGTKTVTVTSTGADPVTSAPFAIIAAPAPGVATMRMLQVR